MSKRLKFQWCINVMLLLLTLLMLIMSAVAWFSTNQTAHVNDIDLYVPQKMIKPPTITRIDLPNATKISDTVTTPNMFNTYGAVAKTYVIEGDGKYGVSVDCGNTGMLAYVCDSSTVKDYYTAVCTDLKKHLGTDKSKWTYANVKEALNTINARKSYGTLNSSGNTEIKIVYWAEYDQLKSKLDQSSYWVSDSSFKAVITFRY